MTFGCQARDMIDDEINDNISELSTVINNPSAEGILTTAESLDQIQTITIRRNACDQSFVGLGVSP